MKKIKNKGELTTQQIVVITILMASFAVLLFLLFRLNLGEQTNAEICHNSVVLKDKSLLGSSLNCRTSYVCISGGEKCNEINPTQTFEIDLSKDDETVKNQTMKAIADEMAQCWWMFGEGEFVYTKGISWVENTACAVCSSVKFDETLGNNKITYQEFYEYLEKTKKDASQTYLMYLYGESSLSSLPLKEDFFKKDIDMNERYVIYTGITKEGVFTLNIFGVLWESLTFERPDLNVKFLPPVPEKSSEMKNSKCGQFVTKA
ncbi:hypothetical protein HYT24_01715 [Candidatus Pacearchaeota archaeon]|nr:hypothetical protein [Candidatus Pacearchaeota archaeon]